MADEKKTPAKKADTKADSKKSKSAKDNTKSKKDSKKKKKNPFKMCIRDRSVGTLRSFCFLWLRAK